MKSFSLNGKNRPSRIIAILALILFSTVVLGGGCTAFTALEDKNDEQDPVLWLLIQIGLAPDAGDYYAKLYYVDPLIVTNPTNSDLIHEATAADVTAVRKKLVIVHGWHGDDPENPSFPYISPVSLKDRVLAQNWSDLFDQNVKGTSPTNLHGVFKSWWWVDPAQITPDAGTNYDVYAFDYLTSRGIMANGVRFRAAMDALFSGETGTVYIYANSMGGLVTRAAIYEGATPAYVAKVVTTGTPHHGSPWASPEFQQDVGPLGSLAAFFTTTTGGQDLRFDNYDGSLPGASNPMLTALNANTDRDSLFVLYYGSAIYIDPTTLPLPNDSNQTFILACNTTNTAFSGTFGPSDCIVPRKSARFDGHTTTTAPLVDPGTGTVGDYGAYDHSDIKLGGNTTSTYLLDAYSQILIQEFP